MKGSALSVITEEFAQTVRRLFQLLDTGQINHAEVIGRFPVEAASVGEEYLFLLEKVENEFLIVIYIESLCVDSWENIERRLGSYNAHAGNGVYGIAYEFALFVDPAAGNKQFSGCICIFERDGNERLCRNIRAESHGREQIYALDVALDMAFFAAE